MTSQMVNLRMARKARAREQAQAQAAANRARFGEPARVRKVREADAARAERTLDGAHRGQDS